jgi:uncharacterized protein YbaP (TraB family)
LTVRRVCCAASTVLILACTLRVPAVAAQDPVAEIVVSGERAGPRLWRVSSQTAQLWILGTVSPLPAGVTWHASQVEQVLSGANALLVAKPLEISLPRVIWMLVAQRDRLMIPGGRVLKDVLPSDLYLRFSRDRSLYGVDVDRSERYRPIIAAALLEDAAMKRHGLSARLDVSLAVRRLAHQRHVPVEDLAVPGAAELFDALRTVAPDLESRCFALVLTTIETGMPLLAARADAWATGDVARIASLPPSSEAACGAVLRDDPRTADLLTRIHDHWFGALTAHLRSSGVTVAVIDMDSLLGAHGLLHDLQDQGFEVDGPLQE